MHSIFRIPWRFALPGLAVAVLFQASAVAAIIKVYDPKGGTDFAGMKGAAKILIGRLEADREGFLSSAPSEINGFSYLVSSGTVVPREFSMASGMPAYIWSENTLRYESGFKFGPVAVQFGKKTEVKQQATKSVPAKPLWSTQFQNATLNGKSLSVNYSLTQGGLVTVEIFGTNGVTVQRWNWRDGDAGAYTRILEMSRTPRKGTLFIRWKNGNSRMTQKIVVLK